MNPQRAQEIIESVNQPTGWTLGERDKKKTAISEATSSGEVRHSPVPDLNSVELEDRERIPGTTITVESGLGQGGIAPMLGALAKVGVLVDGPKALSPNDNKPQLEYKGHGYDPHSDTVHGVFFDHNPRV